jgi:hypothetical protein
MSTALPRTQQEILQKMETVAGRDMFGFQRDLLLGFLKYKYARPFLREGVTKEEWDAARTKRTVDAALDEMRSYMEFAWGKAINERSLSAGRSVQKLEMWCWMIGRDDLAAFAADEDNYPMYGIPILRHLSRELGFPVPEVEA